MKPWAKLVVVGATSVAAGLTVGVGCGSDDATIQPGTGGAGGTFDGGGGTGGGPCTAESDAEFCLRLGKDCGVVSDTDNCGAPRSVANCGNCVAPAICGGGGSDNVCGDPCPGCPSQPLITASRATCTSPCAVFFDVISNQTWADLESGTFAWTFGDGGAAEGFMAAHVFELAEGAPAESFEVRLAVHRDGVAVAQDTTAITVEPLGGRTICVAQSDFSGCPSGDAGDHFTDVGAGWAAIESNGRILFRRGDSFSPGIRFGSPVDGPVQVGAFGDPTAPLPAIVQSGGSWHVGSDWSLTDLDISATGVTGSLISISGVHALVLRSHIHDAEGAFVSDGEAYDFSTHKFLIDNTTTNIEGTNYIAGDYIAILGNHMERWGDNHHTIRIGGGMHVLVADNELISDVGHSSLTVRGAAPRRPETDWVLVQGNHLVQWATVHPQNAESHETLRHVIWERNVQVPHDSQTSIQSGLGVNGHDMVIRNNIFHQIRRAISIETHPLTGASQNIHVYHNSQFIDQDTDRSNSFLSAGSGNTGVVAQNNLALLLGEAPGSSFISGLGADATVGNNYCFAPNLTDPCVQPDGTQGCTDPLLENTSDRASAGFMLPGVGSMAIDSAAAVPVANDYHSTGRPQGSASDVGAVERAE